MISRTALAIGLLATAQLAHAQDAPATAPEEQRAETAQIDDVVVTARKRAEAERLQDVPLAVTALSGDQIQQRQIIDITQLAQAVPNVQMNELGATAGTANLSIRGMGLSGALPTLESPVGVFMDGIYLASPQGVISDLFDLEGIEVLRGPQGTLFGKNVTGGAVLIRTRAPSDTLEVRARAGIETGPEYKFGASISGPISDTLSVRVTGQYSKDEGWFTNDFNGEPFGIEKNWLIRGSARWRPTDAVDLTIRYEHGELDQRNVPVQNYAFTSRDGFDINVDDAGTFTTQEWDQVSAELNIDIGPGTLTNVAGYRKQLSHTFYDSDGTPLRGLYLEFYAPLEQFSNELRYAFTAGRFSLTAGLYYFHSDIGLYEARYLNNIGNGFTPRGYGATQKADTYAAFAQADIAVSDALNVTLGARYSHDPKTASIALFSAAANSCDLITRVCNFAFPNQKDSWNSFTPKIGVQYKVTPDFQVYGSWTRAYRAGGYTSRLTSLTQSLSFDQESVSAFEIGQKADLLDRRLRLNTSAFYNKYTKLIRSVQAPGPGGVVTDTRNTADATIWGVEGELQAAVSPVLTLSAFFGYQNGSYDRIIFSLRDEPGEVPGSITATDLNLAIPRLSPWSYGAGATLVLPVGADMNWRSRVNYSFRDPSFNDDANRVILNNFNSLDASTTLAFQDGRIELTVFGRNILNEAYAGFATGLAPPLVPAVPPGRTSIVAFPSEGRTVGVEANFRF